MEEELFRLMLEGNKKQELNRINNCNQYTEKYGMVLSEQDTLTLLKNRQNNLKEQERVEFGEGILTKLIYAFCDSPYIYQDIYMETLSQLQEIFYLYKNESLDEFSDDELIDYMRVAFNGVCQGSLEYLEDTCLEMLARDIRSRSDVFMSSSEDEDE